MKTRVFFRGIRVANKTSMYPGFVTYNKIKPTHDIQLNLDNTTKIVQGNYVYLREDTPQVKIEALMPIRSHNWPIYVRNGPTMDRPDDVGILKGSAAAGSLSMIAIGLVTMPDEFVGGLVLSGVGCGLWVVGCFVCWLLLIQ